MKFILLSILLVFLISCSSNKYYKRYEDGVNINEPIYYGMIITNGENAIEWEKLKSKYRELQKQRRTNYKKSQEEYVSDALESSYISQDMLNFSENYFTKFFISTATDGSKIYIDIVRPNWITSRTDMINQNNLEYEVEISKIEIRFISTNYTITLDKVNKNLFSSNNYRGFNFNDVEIYVYINGQENYVERDYWNNWSLQVGSEISESGKILQKRKSEKFLSLSYNGVNSLTKTTDYRNDTYKNGNGLTLNYNYVSGNNFGFNAQYYFNSIPPYNDNLKLLEDIDQSIYSHGLLLGPTYTFNITGFWKLDTKILVGFSGFRDSHGSKGGNVTIDAGLNTRFNITKKINLIFNLDYLYIPSYTSDNNGWTQSIYYRDINYYYFGLGIGYRF